MLLAFFLPHRPVEPSRGKLLDFYAIYHSVGWNATILGHVAFLLLAGRDAVKAGVIDAKPRRQPHTTILVIL
jgi:hypothetical protein